MATKKNEKKADTRKTSTQKASTGSRTGKKPQTAGGDKPKPKARRPAKSEPGLRVLTRQDIERRAYEIWEAKGRPEGAEAENWDQAERELRDQR